MEQDIWQLHYRRSGDGEVVEEHFQTEDGFKLAIQASYRSGASDLMATMPDGRRYTEAVLRQRFRPEQ